MVSVFGSESTRIKEQPQSKEQKHLVYVSEQKRYFSFLCGWLFYLHVCLYTTHMPCACRGQKRALEPLKL